MFLDHSGKVIAEKKLTKRSMNSIYAELLDKRASVKPGSIEDERLDAQICLVEELLEKLDE